MRPLCILPLVAALTACGAPSADSPAPPLDRHWLAGHHWRLLRASDGEGQPIPALAAADPAHPPQLDLDVRGRLAVIGACNRMSGDYALEDDHLRVGTLAATRRACAPAAMALDQALAERLQGRLQASVQMDGDTPVLVLTTASGQRLLLRGEITDAVRYGDAGETVFLEVAAQTVACAQSPSADGRCLQVRELRYDDRGLRSGVPGPWHAFVEPIRDYVHRDGIRNVLRLKRYRIADPPAGTPSEAYVLDLVVESEDTRISSPE